MWWEGSRGSVPQRAAGTLKNLESNLLLLHLQQLQE